MRSGKVSQVYAKQGLTFRFLKALFRRISMESFHFLIPN